MDDRKPKSSALKNTNNNSAINRATKTKQKVSKINVPKPRSNAVSKETKLNKKINLAQTKPVVNELQNRAESSTTNAHNNHEDMNQNQKVTKEISIITSEISKMSMNEEESKAKESASKLVGKLAPPKKGKAKYNCGCFGTKHKSIANCLNCARILCAREGYGYCPFCENIIEKVEVKTGSGDQEKDLATMHKERLLKFDREFTQRTVIYDDESDYYSNATSMWMDETEREAELQKDEQRRKEMHERKKQVIDIVF
eukprot:CAMPEP_0197827804 /NCGR_PEP_ID=MMETSP1437-20131217/4511_1 /TAXON_ID=49252 ORGANISM="Eucampia antarctica, Strain CCMP1452" /NCGR_SAMPLE_ID=MMETSP1437 /ASSEMBLY_ACC=CAM_ASM_001096 /LENGTH=255 /DNA_ID=CAMNT_0043428795 /DNA_START=207 /DNA_END=974 /DNA_ORIENTATION=-